MQAWYSLIAIGAVIGIANIIPGVSGGTMAVILNVFDKLIFSISNIKKDFKNSFKFLIFISIGALIGIIGFSFVIKYLLITYPLQLNFFFIGLIIGSIPLIFRKIGGFNKERILKVLFFIIFLVLMIAFTFINSDKSTGIVKEISSIKLFIHSFISTVAMILPGLSGSLVFVILGSYFTIIKAISEFNIIVLIPVMLGVLTGLIVGSKVIAFFLKKYEGITFAAISGLVIGSLVSLFKNVIFTFNIGGVVAILCLLIGTIIAYLFGKTAK